MPSSSINMQEIWETLNRFGSLITIFSFVFGGWLSFLFFQEKRNKSDLTRMLREEEQKVLRLETELRFSLQSSLEGVSAKVIALELSGEYEEAAHEASQWLENHKRQLQRVFEAAATHSLFDEAHVESGPQVSKLANLYLAAAAISGKKSYIEAYRRCLEITKLQSGESVKVSPLSTDAVELPNLTGAFEPADEAAARRYVNQLLPKLVELAMEAEFALLEKVAHKIIKVASSQLSESDESIVQAKYYLAAARAALGDAEKAYDILGEILAERMDDIPRAKLSATCLKLRIGSELLHCDVPVERRQRIGQELIFLLLEAQKLCEKSGDKIGKVQLALAQMGTTSMRGPSAAMWGSSPPTLPQVLRINEQLEELYQEWSGDSGRNMLAKYEIDTLSIIATTHEIDLRLIAGERIEDIDRKIAARRNRWSLGADHPMRANVERKLTQPDIFLSPEVEGLLRQSRAEVDALLRQGKWPDAAN